MSERWPGGVVRAIPVTPTGPTTYGSAPGVWTLDQAAYWQKQGLWPNANIVPDPYFNYVSLLLSSTSLGNANNNLFVDSSGAFNPVGRLGNTTQGSFTPYSTNWSNYFDGSGDYLSIPSSSSLNFGTGNWTIECWVYVSTRTTNYPLLFGNNRGAWTTDALALTLSNADSASYNDKFVFAWNNGGFSSPSAGTSQLLVANVTNNKGTWYHFAAVRNGTSVKMYRDGVEVASATVSAAATFSWGFNGSLIGGGNWDGASSYMDGYVSNLRVTSSAVYTAAFTPPTSPLTAISGTVYLTCQSNRFRDASTNNFTITSFGNTSVQDFNPFLSSTYTGITYNQSDITNWSGYFNGSTDYLTAPTGSPFQFGTGSFTVEAWIYINSNPTGSSPTTYYTIYDGCPIGGSGARANAFAWFINSSGNLQIFSGSNFRTASSATVPLRQWVHVAIVRNGSSTVTYYINGQSAGTATVAQDMTTGGCVIARLGDSADGHMLGSISNLRIVKGAAVYTSNFTPPTTNLSAISGTSLLTCQNAAFTDNSTNNFVITQNGTPTVTGNSPFNTVGFWSNYFDGSGDYFTVPYTAANFDWYTAGVDFTIEYWFFANSSTGISYSDAGFNHSTVVGNRSATATTDYWSFGPTSAGTVTFYYFNGGANAVTSTATYSLNTWNHVAMTKTSSGITVFVNGVAGTTTAISGTPQSSTGVPLTVGQGNNSSFNGYVSNLRIVRGTAIYSGNFTVPITPLTAVTNTKLLTCQASQFVDNSTNALTLTLTGNTSVQSFDPFYTSTIASNGGSIFADGTGDYLTIPSSPTIAPLSSAFTWECWFYPNSFVGNTGDGDTLWITSGSGGLQIGCDANTANWGVARNGIAWVLQTSTFPTNKMWNHIAIVRSGTGTNQAAIFLNGTRVVQGTLSSSFPAGSTNVLSANGGAGNSIDGYVSNMRLVVGTAIYDPSVSTCTVPTAPLSPTPATSLLINGMNAGIYDATTINDMETVGNAQVSTVQSKFGGSSLSFGGGSNRLQIPINPQLYLGATYTIEAWIYANSFGRYTPVFTEMEAFQGGFAFMGIYTHPSGQLATTVRDATGGTVYEILSASALSTATWYHVAMSVSNGTMRQFINGVQQGSTLAVPVYPVAKTVTAAVGGWGSGWSDANNGSWDGYIDDFRITKGVARYTSNFTPPTQAFPVY